MPPLSKTASTALAAAVVAAVAALVPLTGSGPAGASARPAPTPAVSSRPAPSAGRPDPAPSLPAAGPDGSAPVLFLGDSPALHPRGGTDRSYACRAVKRLGRHCRVLPRTGPAVPAGTRADAVVVVLSPQDDVTTVAAALDALPASLHGAGAVLLAPVVVVQPAAVTARLAGIRQLASTRGATVVDPAGLHWVTAATRRTYLAADGVQPTAVGLEHLAERLGRALTAAGV